jgi:hypothetical protein
MALGTAHTTLTTSDAFIPELWSNEVLGTYKGKTVMSNLVSKVPFKGKKGDTLHIPVPGRDEASVKAAETQVNLIADTATLKDVIVDKHYEYSRLYEDIAELQALSSMRKFYTDDAGYALAKRVDRELHKVGALLNGGSVAGATNLYESAVIGGDGDTAFSGASSGNGTALTDAGIRKMIQTLEDQDVDSAALAMVIPPVVMHDLRGIARFTEQAFVGDGSAIKTGNVGNLYGVEIYTSSQCPWIHTNSVTDTQSVNFNSADLTAAAYEDEFGHTVDWSTSTPTDTKYRAGLLFHKDAIALAEQMSVRTQSQYKQEYLGTLVTSDCVFGTAELRDYSGLAFVVPA